MGVAMAIAGLAGKAMARLTAVSIRVIVSMTILTYLPGVNKTRRSRAQIVCDYSHIASGYGFPKFLRIRTITPLQGQYVLSNSPL
jgi:hypothetical protein